MRPCACLLLGSVFLIITIRRLQTLEIYYKPSFRGLAFGQFMFMRTILSKSHITEPKYRQASTVGENSRRDTAVRKSLGPFPGGREDHIESSYLANSCLRCLKINIIHDCIDSQSTQASRPTNMDYIVFIGSWNAISRETEEVLDLINNVHVEFRFPLSIRIDNRKRCNSLSPEPSHPFSS